MSQRSQGTEGLQDCGTAGPNAGSRVQVAVGLGANLGTPATAFRSAVAALQCGGMTEIVLSPLYRTAPVNCVPGTPPFTNAALVGGWPASPEELLVLCQTIELDLGRPGKHSSQESRIADLDILLFGNVSVRLPKLIIPHPRLTQRLFALAPLADIAPQQVVPGTGKTVKELRDALLEAGHSESVERVENSP